MVQFMTLQGYGKVIYPDPQYGGCLMANMNVTLLWRCKTDFGWRRYPALFAKNGRPRKGIVQVAGREICYPVGRFQLRYYTGSRQIFADAGENPTDALNACHQMELKLAAKAAADDAGIQIVEDAPRRRSVASAFRDFLESVENRGKLEAKEVYELAGREFLACAGKVFVDEITREDLEKHQRRMRDQGYSDRTIHNRHANVRAFLNWLGLDVKKLAGKRPQYEKTVPEAYTLSEMKSFFAFAAKKPKLALTYEIMLKCGLREQEGMYLEWANVDLENGKCLVRSNPRFGFKVKDKEQREVPIERDLLATLKKTRKKYPLQRLVTGTASDKPHTHLLRALKRLVNKAGLQCGACPGCRRTKDPECERWFLHKFRATYVTNLLRGGMDLRTVMKYSGHSDLESVQRYLSPADDESARGIVNRVRWS
jgi:integrase